MSPGAGALPHRAADRASTAATRAAHSGRVRDLRPRQRRRPRRGARPACANACRRIARTTSRRWRTRRSPTPRRIAAAHDGVHDVDRPGRDQPGDRRRARARQSAAGAAAARRRVRQPPPDPVLQQVEDFGDGTVTANDCFRPVSRYFDRITRSGAAAAPRCRRRSRVLTDPGGLRAGDARAAAGRAGGGVRLSRRDFSRPASTCRARTGADARTARRGRAVAATRASGR